MKFIGYMRTVIQYLHTPKGGHDAKDDLKALLLYAVTVAIIIAVVYIISMR